MPKLWYVLPVSLSQPCGIQYANPHFQFLGLDLLRAARGIHFSPSILVNNEID
jgi:hypothetical protein